MSGGVVVTPPRTPSSHHAANTSVRLPPLDALRGLALLAIAVVNAPLIAWPGAASFVGMLPQTSSADRWADVLVQGLLQSRVYPLYALLFGAGLGFLVLRNVAHGEPLRRGLWRRCVILLLLGVVHATLVWQGDVLTTHALVGLALLVGVRWSRRVWLTVSGVLFGLAVLFLLALTAISASGLVAPELLEAILAAKRSAVAADARILADGSWMEVHGVRLREWQTYLAAQFVTLPVFLLSAALGFVWVRDGAVARAFEEPLAWRRRSRLGLAFSGAVGAVLVGCFAWSDRVPMGPLSRALLVAQLCAGPVLAVALFAFAVSARSFGRGRLGRALAATGRLSLTHYVGQSAVLTTLFCGWGMGLSRVLGPAGAVLVAGLLWTAQLLVSGPWLARFHLGPLEWLWRSLSNRERQPFVRRQELLQGNAHPS